MPGVAETRSICSSNSSRRRGVCFCSSPHDVVPESCTEFSVSSKQFRFFQEFKSGLEAVDTASCVICNNKPVRQTSFLISVYFKKFKVDTPSALAA